MQPIQTSEPLPALDVELAGLAMMNPIDPRPAYVDALSRCPMARTPTGSVAVFDMDLLVEINRHPGIHGAGGSVYPKGTMGAERPLIPLDLDGEDHRKFRHLLDPMFSPRRIAGLEKRVRSRTNALIDQFIDAGRAELYESFCNPLPSGIFLDIMGVPNSELDNFVRFKDAVVRPSGDTIEEMMASSQAAGKNTYAFFNAFLDERAARHEPGDDLIGWLMTAEIDERPLTRLEILDTTYLLMIAGLDTVEYWTNRRAVFPSGVSLHCLTAKDGSAYGARSRREARTESTPCSHSGTIATARTNPAEPR